MTYQNRRLGDLLDDIRYRFSIGGAKLRHPPDRIKQLHNVSWQQLRTIVSLANEGTFMEATAIASLPIVAAVTDEVYAEVDWPVSAERVLGIRCQTAAGKPWYPLKPLSWASLHDYQHHSLVAGWRRQSGPIGYITRKIPSTSETVENVGKIMLVPVPLSGRYRLWYIEAWQPQVEDDDLFPGIAEWHEWAIYNTLIKMLTPDADSQKMYPMLAAERAAARAQIESWALKSDGLPMEVRDGRMDGLDGNDLYGGPL